MNPGAAKRWLGMVGLALCLAACNGGSGGDSDSTGGGGGTGSETPGGSGPSASDGTTANAINPNESATLLADIEMAGNASASLRVWDPAQPTVLVASQSPAAADELLKFSWARTLDASTRTEHQTARVLAFHTGDGHVWLTDLRGGADHRPRQLSALDGLYATQNVVPIGLDGLSAWVNVTRGDATRGSVTYAVHSGMGKASVALRGKVLAALPDGSGAGKYIAVATSDDAGQSGLSVLAANGSDVGFTTVAGGAEGEVYWVGLDPSQTGRAYVVVNKQVRRLLWSDGGVSLDAGFSYALSPNGAKAAGSANGMLWVKNDIAGVLRIEGDTVRSLGSFITGSQAHDAGSSIVATGAFFSRPPPLACCNSYEAMDKATGVVTRLADLWTNDSSLLAITDGKLIYVESGSWGVVDTTSGRFLGKGAASEPVVGLVFAAEKAIGSEPALQAMVVCTWDVAINRCGAGPVSQLNFDGTVQKVLGELPPGASLNPPSTPAHYVTGQTSSLHSAPLPSGTDSSSNRDLWQFTPGVAGSLQRVTQHLP